MTSRLVRCGVCAGLFLLSAALAAQALAQSYPSRSLRLIVPYAPGAINDVVARTVGQKLAETLGKPVVIDNRSGGGTIVGTEIAVRSPPDGHTLLMTSAAHAINPTLYGKLPYDAMRDLTQVTVIGAAPLLLVVTPSLPAKSVKDLIALAKAKPGQLTYGSSGTGGGAHLAFEMLKALAGIDLTHVPYKGAGPAVVDVIAGQVQMTMGTIVAVGPHVKSGRLRALALSSTKRSPLAPELPPLAEACCPGYDATFWWGVAVPAATPKSIVATLNAAILDVLRMPEIVERFTGQGVELIGSTPQSAAAHLKADTARWSKVIVQAGIKPE